MPDSPTLTFEFAHISHLLLSKAWVILLTMVFILIAAVGYLTWTPKIYESKAVLEVAQETPQIKNVQDFDGDEAWNAKSPEVLKTIEQTLLSETLMIDVVKTNGLDKDPSFAPPKKDGSAYMESELAAMFKSKLSVKLRRGTRLIDIAVDDKDRNQAKKLAESMVKE